MEPAAPPPGTCVIGHAHPDTDSVCSAIAYARLCQLRGEDDVYPARQGELRPDTAWVLDRFDVEPPLLVTDVRPRMADVMTAPVITALEGASLLEVAELLHTHSMRSLPIVDDGGRFAGLVRLEDFARFFLEGGLPEEVEELSLDLDAVVRAIEGTVLVAARDRPLSDRVRVAASSIDIVLARVPPGAVAVVGDRHDVQEALIWHGVGALIVTGGLTVREEIVRLARKHQVTVISTPHHTFAAVRLISMSAPASFIMRRDAMTATPDSFVADIRPVVATQRSLPVVDAAQRPVGIFSGTDLTRSFRRKVALVDHNERSQAVAGLDEADVVAIIDHHRIATIQTAAPILLRCEPVGATATIVAQLYREAGQAVPEEIAGLLLSSIVTDTVLFRSPTCTDADRAVAADLSRLAGVDALALGQEIFTRASDVDDVSPRDLLLRDFKEFPVHGRLYGIAAIETGNAAALLPLRVALRTELGRLRRQRPYEVAMCMIVDVLQEETELLISGHEKTAAAIFGQPLLAGAKIVLPYIVSRKQQLVPLLGSLDDAIQKTVSR